MSGTSQSTRGSFSSCAYKQQTNDKENSGMMTSKRDTAVSQVRSGPEPKATLCTCSTSELSVSVSHEISPTKMIIQTELSCIFVGSEFPKLCGRCGGNGGNISLSARIHPVTAD